MIKIDKKAFENCPSLKQVTLPPYDISIKENAFDPGVQLVKSEPKSLETEIEVPSSMTEIEDESLY
ncbi:hypothetical protein M9Y10_031798 [Tritrichomonas musculus]|uniref:Leucine-rich repeat domain-containing protein n=1 Tax=Tritrichomonas musculus TaxID=1915356 RepID=A0ABR2GZT2_9EUKA